MLVESVGALRTCKRAHYPISVLSACNSHMASCWRQEHRVLAPGWLSRPAAQWAARRLRRWRSALLRGSGLAQELESARQCSMCSVGHGPQKALPLDCPCPTTSAGTLSPDSHSPAPSTTTDSRRMTTTPPCQWTTRPPAHHEIPVALKATVLALVMAMLDEVLEATVPALSTLVLEVVPVLRLILGEVVVRLGKQEIGPSSDPWQ